MFGLKLANAAYIYILAVPETEQRAFVHSLQIKPSTIDHQAHPAIYQQPNRVHIVRRGELSQSQARL